MNISINLPLGLLVPAQKELLIKLLQGEVEALDVENLPTLNQDAATDEKSVEFSPAEARALLISLGKKSRAALDAMNQDTATDDNLVKFSPAEARAFLKGCSKKSRAAIDAMTKKRGRFVHLKDVAAALDTKPDELSHTIWSGLTRRTRTISGDPDSYLLAWDAEGVYDEDETLIDWRGWLTPETRDAFRKVLDKK